MRMRIVIDLSPETPISEMLPILREIDDAIGDGEMVSTFPDKSNPYAIRIECDGGAYSIGPDRMPIRSIPIREL